MNEVLTNIQGNLPQVTLASLNGCWRRNWICLSHGSQDAKTRVWWLQSDHFYADIRIPPDRPSFEGIDSLENCSPKHRQWLATQQGFAGRLSNLGTAFHWERHLDFQPPTKTRDVGQLRFIDDQCTIMLEQGVEQPYQEEWERIDNAADPLVLKLESTQPHERGLLIATGQHIVMAIDHRPPLPIAESLWSLCKNCSDTEQIKLLDMEISHGRRTGPIADWLIDESTFPWLEGRKIFETFSPRRWSKCGRD